MSAWYRYRDGLVLEDATLVMSPEARGLYWYRSVLHQRKIRAVVGGRGKSGGGWKEGASGARFAYLVLCSARSLMNLRFKLATIPNRQTIAQKALDWAGQSKKRISNDLGGSQKQKNSAGQCP